MIRTPEGKVVVFWRAKCRLTGRDEKFCSHLAELPDFETMRKWVDDFFRRLELLEVRPWGPEDSHRILFPVPVQHVKFDVKVPDLAQPDPRRRSLLFSRRLGARPLGRRLLVKG